MSAASASTTSAAVTPTPHAALAFFDSHPSSFSNLLRSGARDWYQRGHEQLVGALGLPIGSFDELHPEAIVAAGSSSGWLKSPAQEQTEIEEFLAWVTASSNLVRQVNEVLPPATYAEAATSIASVELIDFSPKGRIDDVIFEKHRDVWERITRGCAVIKIVPKEEAASAAPIYRWAVRANRKFTGHEDDSAVADPNLYRVPENGAPDTVVVSHKCNGSVLHLAARDIAVGGTTYRWVFLGSKKVHVGCIWNTNTGADDWAAKMALFNAERHVVVSEMVSYILPHLRARAPAILTTLAVFRLVINAEYISSIGTGPTDNERIYSMSNEQPREAFAFMLTFNTLQPAKECELGLHFMSGLRLLHHIGFKTVSAFEIPLTELPRAKVAVLPLPDIEGAVLYYSNQRTGLTQLEKWKSSGYVVLRAVREKLKPFIYGSRDYPGLATSVDKIDASSAQSSLRIEKKVLTTSQLAAEAKPKKAKNSRQRKKAAEAKRKAAAADQAAVALETLEIDSGNDEEEAKSATAPTSAASSAAAVIAAPSYVVSPDTYLEFTAPELDQVGLLLSEKLGAQRVAAGVWRCACPADSAEESRVRADAATLFHGALVLKPVSYALQKCTERVQGRIRAIDHIPMSDEERAAWLAESAAFLQWLTTQIIERRRWPAKDVMQQYSRLWSIFRAEVKQAAAAKQQ